MMKLFSPGPERITLYFCKQCEKMAVGGDYRPNKCTQCDSTDFWSEFEEGAPCNREEDGEEWEPDLDDEFFEEVG